MQRQSISPHSSHAARSSTVDSPRLPRQGTQSRMSTSRASPWTERELADQSPPRGDRRDHPTIDDLLVIQRARLGQILLDELWSKALHNRTELLHSHPDCGEWNVPAHLVQGRAETAEGRPIDL